VKTIHDILNAKSGRALEALLQSERGFPNGFWHAADAEGAFDVMGGALEVLGLDAAMLSEAYVRAVVERHAASARNDEDEDLARRREIAEVAAHLDVQLEGAKSPHRFFAFAEDLSGWESEEPVWMLLTEEERALLLGRNVVRALVTDRGP
jgi:hypothetical protein